MDVYLVGRSEPLIYETCIKTEETLCSWVRLLLYCLFYLLRKSFNIDFIICKLLDEGAVNRKEHDGVCCFLFIL